MNLMKSHTAEIVWRLAFILGALALAVLMLHPEPLLAQTDACALLKADDVAPLLGGTPTHTATPEGQACTWIGASADRKLIVLTYKNMGVPGEAAFMGARKGAQAGENAKVSDETGIGDRAFSGQVSFGALFVVLKQGRLLQLQYWTGGQGTSQDVAALRPVVQKAVAAF
jgi:hypothetical protein